MTDISRDIRIIDVSPRDGLQIERTLLDVSQKVALIDMIIQAGIREIEVGSFVNPKAVPQMAMTDDVIQRIRDLPDVTYRALWLNLKGLERALGHDKLSIDGRLTLTASETFSRRNTNKGIEESFAAMLEWIDRYEAAGIGTWWLGLMAAFGCNFEGEISAEHVIGLIERTTSIIGERGGNLDRISLADTMGWANPEQIRRLISEVRTRWPDLTIRLHLHDTRGLAIANALAALELGVREFDAAIGGLGGCPFAGHKGAAGNLCTEDLVFAAEETGWTTGADLDALIEVAREAERMVGHELPGKLMKGGSLTAARSA